MTSPCRWCKSPAIEVIPSGTGPEWCQLPGRWLQVRCTGCWARGPEAGDHDGAISAWRSSGDVPPISDWEIS